VKSIKCGDFIRFKHEGASAEGEVLSVDSDPTCSLWVVDRTNPDRDYLVKPCDIECCESSASAL